MSERPLRLGISTGSIRPCLPEDLGAAAWTQEEFSEELSERIRRMALDMAETIRSSEVQAIEFFIARAMLRLGAQHPMTEFVRNLGDRCRLWSVHAPFGGVDIASPEEGARTHSVRDICRAAEIAEALGAGILVVHPGLEYPNPPPRPLRIDASVQSVAEIADYCAPKGIQVAVEFLPRQCIGNSLEEILTIVEGVDRPNVGVCLDSNHTFPARDLPKIVRALGSRLLTLHVSDHDDTDEKHWMPGLGVIDWPEFVQALREIQYQGPFLCECTLRFASFAEGIAALKSTYHTIMAE